MPTVQAQEFKLPAPGMMVHLSLEFTPAHLKGLVVHPENALRFDFLVTDGDEKLTDQQQHKTYQKLIKYFLASLAVSDENQWVNLSPYEKDRIIKDDFGKTEMGRDLLAQDYLLKQITASMIYPEDSLGKRFWDKVYTQAQQQFGTSNIPVNTFNKVWIIPDTASVYEHGNLVYVVSQHLKVMLEEDYLSLEKHSGISSKSLQKSDNNKVNALGSQIVREIVLPALEKEINENKNFAMLRQVYSAMILAAWYKRVLKESLLGKIYANKAKLKGVDQDPKNNQEIYQRYLKAFKKGAFNYIKEDIDKYTKEPIPRKYFSGGVVNPFQSRGVDHWNDVVHQASLVDAEASRPSDLKVVGVLGQEIPVTEVTNGSEPSKSFRRNDRAMTANTGTNNDSSSKIKRSRVSELSEEEVARITRAYDLRRILPSSAETISRDWGSARLSFGEKGQVIHERDATYCNYIILYDKKNKRAALIHAENYRNSEMTTEVIDKTLGMLTKAHPDAEIVAGIFSPNERGYIDRSNGISDSYSKVLDLKDIPRFETDLHFSWGFENHVEFVVDEGVFLSMNKQGTIQRAVRLDSTEISATLTAEMLNQKSNEAMTALKLPNGKELTKDQYDAFRSALTISSIFNDRKNENIVQKALQDAVGGRGTVRDVKLENDITGDYVSFRIDAAMNGTEALRPVTTRNPGDPLGGIDFNAANMNLQIKRDGKGVPLPISQQNLKNIKIDGLIPVIIDIKPAASLPILSGLSNTLK